METAGLTEKDVTIVNTSDADIVAAFTAAPDMNAVVTRDPQLAAVLKVPGASLVFDSSMIRGEIIDLMVVNTQILRDNPDLGKALTGAWYEVMAAMQRKDEAGASALDFMAKASGTDIAGYEAQLGATRLFSDPQSAVVFAKSADLADHHEPGAQVFLRPRSIGQRRRFGGRNRHPGSRRSDPR